MEQEHPESQRPIPEVEPQQPDGSPATPEIASAPEGRERVEDGEQEKEERLAALEKEVADLQSDDTVPVADAQTDEKPPEEKKSIGQRVVDTVFHDRLSVNETHARHMLGPEANNEEIQKLAHAFLAEWPKAIRYTATPRSKEWRREHTDFQGLERVKDQLEQQGKAIVVTAHSAYFPAAMQQFQDFLPENTNATVLTETNPIWPLIDAWQRIRKSVLPKNDSRRNVDVMPRKSRDPKTMLSVVHRLKRGKPDGQRELFFLAGDRADLSADSRRTEVDFFDTKTHFPTGPATISAHTEAPIIPVFVTRQGERLNVTFGEVIPPSNNTDEGLAETTQQIATFFESQIKQKPEQWLVYRKDFWPDQEDYKP